MSSFGSSLPQQVLVFDLWGDYACFRRFYTTASPLTFAVPPPPTLAGILGAILGVSKEDYMEVLGADHCRLGVRLLQPVKKMRLGTNWIKTKDRVGTGYFSQGRIGERDPVMVEFLKDPAYRIYAAPANEATYANLRDNLVHHCSVFTVSLGLSELLANFRWVGEFAAEPLEPGRYEVATIVPQPSVRWTPEGQGIQFEEGKAYVSELLPMAMNRHREVSRYDQIIISTTGQTILADIKEGVRLGDECVVFF